jgi:hypothetical protein
VKIASEINDGQIVNFLTTETDFYVLVAVQSLDDYDMFGNRIAAVMQVVGNQPDDAIPGSMPGFVEFQFKKSSLESFGVQVPIQQYKEVSQGKTGKGLFDLFYTKP